MGVVESWNRLIDLWRTMGHPIVERLQPGLSRDEILAITEPVGFILHEDVIAFYQCCNGSAPYTQPQEDGKFYSHYWIPELRDVVAQIKELDDVEEYMPAWKFFPFLQDDAYFFGVRSVPEADDSYPVYNWPEDTEPYPVFDSLTAMLDTMYQWYTEGAMDVLKEEGNSDEAPDSYAEVINGRMYITIAANRNPKCDYWKRAIARYPEVSW